jgi:hypothetical protein
MAIMMMMMMITTTTTVIAFILEVNDYIYVLAQRFESTSIYTAQYLHNCIMS